MNRDSTTFGKRWVALMPLLLALTLVLVASGSASAIKITGRGWGHGVGMSQWGAYGYAKHGYDYKQILYHYYTGTTIDTLPAGKKMRVLLLSAGSISFGGATSVGGTPLKSSGRYVATPSGSSVVVKTAAKGKKVGKFDNDVHVSGSAPLTLYGTAINGRRDGRYRGDLVLHTSGGILYAVNSLNVEGYVKGVVPAESVSSWPIEELKAQAVAARSYALATAKKNSYFDQYPDTRSQVYAGVGGEAGSSNRAVDRTSGEILKYKGKVATTYFFDSSGGRTENIEDAWPGSDPVPYLKSVDDPYDSLSPDHTWGPLTFSSRQITSALGQYLEGSFKTIEVVQRGPGGHVVKAKIVGSKGSSTASGPTIETALGLKSSWFYVSK